jgi:GMP synthase-like glutamine amidotransferase
MPTLPLRIAILECGTPSPKTAKKYGGYGGVFTSLLETAASSLSYPGFTPSASSLSISIFDVKHAPGSYPSLDDIDGVLLTGSASNAFDNDDWIIKLVQFVNDVLAQRRVRIVGACFGHQIVARALGARVGRSGKGWETGVTEMELTEKGREIFGKQDLVSDIRFRLIVSLMHF